jgi:hypothetical protein
VRAELATRLLSATAQCEIRDSAGCRQRPSRASVWVSLLLTLLPPTPIRRFAARDRSNSVTEAERRAERQSMARRTNAVIIWLDEQDDDLTILCECGALECRDSLIVSRKVYSRVREHRSRFLVASGHEHNEAILELLGTCAVIENVNAPAAPEPAYAGLLAPR